MRVKAICKNCSGIVEGRGKTYCSVKCHSDIKYKNYIERWLLGEEDGARGGVAVSRHIRRWMKETYGENAVSVVGQK